MDPVTMIVSALAAGGTAAAQATASQVVKDAYQGLKTLILGHFAQKPEAQTALTQHERRPEVWEAPLKDSLIETGAGEDRAVLEAAHKLLEIVGPALAARDKYNVRIGKAQGVTIGDYSDVTQNFEAGRDQDIEK